MVQERDHRGIALYVASDDAHRGLFFPWCSVNKKHPGTCIEGKRPVERHMCHAVDSALGKDAERGSVDDERDEEAIGKEESLRLVFYSSFFSTDALSL